MSRETQVPAIPAPSDSNVVQTLQAIKSSLDVREGRLGDPLDQFVSLRELKALGLVKDGSVSTTIVGGNNKLPVIGTVGSGVFGPDNYDETTDLTTPPAPTGLTATATITNVYLSWNGAAYSNHSYTEIWRSETNALGSAVMVGTTIGSVYQDPARENTTYFYWIRFVSRANVKGPYNATNGTQIKTGQDPARLLQILTGQITESQLYQDLAARINLIDGPTTLVGSVNSRVLDEANARAAAVLAEANARIAADNSLGSSITTLQNTTATQATQITQLTTRTTAAESSITTLNQTTASQATSLSNLTTRVGTAESSITTLNQTTSSQATSLSNLTTRVGTAESSISSLQTTTASQATSISSLTTRVGSAESNITSLQTTTSGQATQISSISTTLGTKTRTFVQNDAPTSTGSYTLVLNDLWYDSDDGLKPYRWNGSAWADLTDTRLLNAGSSINTLQSTTATQATQITSLNTRTSTAESNISSLQTTTSTQATQISGLTTRVGTAETSITNLQTTTANQATSISTLNSTVNSNTTSIQTLTSTTNGLSAQYTVKVDSNGYVSGFGLASTPINGTPSSSFVVRADSFAVASPSGPGITPAIPFIVRTTGVIINGKYVPPGVYIDSAWIQNGTITSAQITTLTADQITSGTITATVDLQSPIVRSGLVIPGSAGFYLGNYGGVNQFYVGNGSTGIGGRSLSFDGNNAEVRGGIYAYFGTIGGILIDATGISSSNYVGGVSGFSLNTSGAAEFRNVTVRGNVEATSLATGTAMVQTANIVNGAITSAKIGDAQITSAKIGNAEVGTLKIGGNAVTVPIYNSSFVDTRTFNSSWYTVMSMTVPVSGLQSGEYVGLIVNSVSSIYPADSVETDVILGIFINGVLMTELAASIAYYGFSHAGAGYALVTNGSNSVEFKYRSNSNKQMTIVTYATALAGKR